MGKLLNLITPLHTASKRDYLSRMMDDKPHCMNIASQYDFNYWDGERRYGYGGYKYIPGRWSDFARRLIEIYKLGPESNILDLGCGKGYLIYEMLLIEPKLNVVGIDNSKYAIQNAKEEVKSKIINQSVTAPIPFSEGYFDLVLSLATLHNLAIYDLYLTLNQIQKIGKQAFIMVESYRNEKELFNLQCWALTCKSFFSKEEWIWIFNEAGYIGDYEFIYFE